MASNKNNRFKTADECTNYLKQIGINNIKCIQYGGTHKSRSMFQCLIDGYKWESSLDCLKNRYGCGCPKCSRVAKIKDTDEVNRWLKENNISIECIEYAGTVASSQSKFKCLIDGYEWNAKVSNIKSGRGCPVCSKVKKIRDIEEVNKWLKDNNKNIICLEYASTVAAKSLFHCNICNRDWRSSFNNIKNGNNCPHCHISNGERLIRDLLDEYNIDYKQEYCFDDCRDINALPFDFVLFKNHVPKAVIEFQGAQHFIPVDFAGKGKEWAVGTMQKTQDHDMIKFDYCVENKIYYYEIAYWDFEYKEFFDEWKPRFIEFIQNYKKEEEYG